MRLNEKKNKKKKKINKKRVCKNIYVYHPNKSGLCLYTLFLICNMFREMLKSGKNARLLYKLQKFAINGTLRAIVPFTKFPRNPALFNIDQHQFRSGQ